MVEQLGRREGPTCQGTGLVLGKTSAPWITCTFCERSLNRALTNAKRFIVVLWTFAKLLIQCLQMWKAFLWATIVAKLDSKLSHQSNQCCIEGTQVGETHHNYLWKYHQELLKLNTQIVGPINFISFHCFSLLHYALFE